MQETAVLENIESDTEGNEKVYSNRPRLKITNLPKFAGAGALKKYCKQAKLRNPKKIRVSNIGSGTSIGFISFDTMEDLEHAKEIIPTIKFKSCQLGAVESLEKFGNFKSEKRSNNKNWQNNECTFDAMLAAIQPLANMSYDEQIDIKQADCKRVFDTLAQKIEETSCENLDASVIKTILRSPITEHWRNKCELAIAQQDGKWIVGHTHGRDQQSKAQIVFEVNERCRLLTSGMVALARHFQGMLSLQTQCAFEETKKVGVWKMITIREFDGEQMLIVTVALDPEINEHNEKIQQVKSFLYENYRAQTQNSEMENGFRVISLFIAYQVRPGDEPRYERLCGAPYLYTRIFNHRFHVSPQSFYQPNTYCAEVLYDVIRRLAFGDSKPSARLELDDGIAKKRILLDICCGTGTIGITLAKYVDVVIGLEICENAIVDARRNAEINLRNKSCRFVVGPAEKTFQNLKYYLPSANDLPPLNLNNCEIIGILDPPRQGLHSKLIAAIRDAIAIKRIVFCACNIKASMQNIVDLCRTTSNRYRNSPFNLVTVQPVDMFPGTYHYEWVMLLKR